PFSTIRFLKVAQKRSSRRIKMEHFLLWLLRTLLLILLALAFAMPIVRAKKFGNLVSRTARDVAIVMDGSYSMNYQMNQQAVWHQTTELAAAIIEGLGDKDRFCVYLAGDHVTPVFEQLTGKKEEAATRLRALPLPTGSSRLCPATIAALDAMEQDARRSERELHIISDFQLLPWGSFRKGTNATHTVASSVQNEPGENAWDPQKVRDNTTCFVTLLGTPEPKNVAVTDIELDSKLITAEIPCQVTASLLRNGPPLDTAVSIIVDDKEVARRSVKLNDGTVKKVPFMLPLLSGGVHAVRVETPTDSLSDDDPFYCLVRVREKLPVLCVGEPDSILFLKAVFGASADGVSPIDAKVTRPDALAGENLAAYSCVFLCNATALPGQQIKRFENYVAGGGLLVIFPGDRAALSDYATWASLPAEPQSFIELPATNRKRLLIWDKPKHPVLWGLVNEGTAPSIVIKRQLQCPALKERAETLVSTGSGDPFLMVRPHGRGTVVLFAVSADRTWSDFPLSPFFLPMMHQLTQYAAGVGAGQPYLWTTESLLLTEFLPEATYESAIKDSDSKPDPLRSTEVEGGTQIYAEGLTKPGFYTMSTPGGGPATLALAFNIPRTESDLTPVRQQDIPDILGISALHVAIGKDDLMKKLEDFRVGQSLSESLLWLALLIAIAEVFYANFLLRKNSTLTDGLTIDPSGRVKEKQA
ncbi:MAG: vWA domain-containing protein, partial [bacterium]